MKKLAIAALLTSFAMTGCATQGLTDEKVMVVDGQATTVKVVDIPSFTIEVDPRKAVCEVMDAAGNSVESECLQYRQAHQKNFNTIHGSIQGFTYEPGYRYMLDVSQKAVADEASGVVKPVWILNDVISKVAEPTVVQ